MGGKGDCMGWGRTCGSIDPQMAQMTQMRTVLDHLIISLSDLLIGSWAFRLEDSPSDHSLQVLAEAAPGFTLLSLTRILISGIPSSFTNDAL